jgi:hypothetical protein
VDDKLISNFITREKKIAWKCKKIVGNFPYGKTHFISNAIVRTISLLISMDAEKRNEEANYLDSQYRKVISRYFGHDCGNQVANMCQSFAQMMNMVFMYGLPKTGFQISKITCNMYIQMLNPKSTKRKKNTRKEAMKAAKKNHPIPICRTCQARPLKANILKEIKIEVIIEQFDDFMQQLNEDLLKDDPKAINELHQLAEKSLGTIIVHIANSNIIII